VWAGGGEVPHFDASLPRLLLHTPREDSLGACHRVPATRGSCSERSRHANPDMAVVWSFGAAILLVLVIYFV
jgi:hypothetical protein